MIVDKLPPLPPGAVSITIDMPPVGPLMLFLSPNAIEFFGDLLDRQWPGVHLYEYALKAGDHARFVRALGETDPP